jgi:hypothetical protein
MSDVIRARRVPALLAAVVAVATLAGCGSGHVRQSRQVVVNARGRVGPLHVDESNRADVISFAGSPESERRGRYARPYLSYDALGYGCKGKPATDKAGIPRCKTVFYVEPRGGKLELLYTEDRRYVDPHGVHPGMRAPAAERRLRRHAFNGCFSGFRFDTKAGFLVMWFYGGRALVSEYVGFLVVHSQHLNPGVLDCVDS